MPKSAFPYPGGKYYTADRIIDKIPDHQTYVEPFGGAATILFNKSPSTVEVYNDQNRDVVQFFHVLRDRPEELHEWLSKTPYSRDLHQEWAEEYYEGERPDDDIEQAGRFFYLRYAQSSGKLATKSGFRSGVVRNAARQTHNSVEELDWFANRLRGVVIENKDYSAIIDQFDSEDTCFYFDPPYVGSESHYSSEFDHNTFTDSIADLDADWILTYDELPDCTDWGEYRVQTKDGHYRMSGNHDEGAKETTEYLVLNFDPGETPMFSEANQTALGSYGGEA